MTRGPFTCCALHAERAASASWNLCYQGLGAAWQAMLWQWRHDAKRPVCDTNTAHQIASRTTSGPMQSFLSSLAHLLSMHTSHAVSCSGNGGDQKQAASTLINTAQKIASQLTPAPTPTPTPQANFLNLPNLGNLQGLLGALPGNQVCASRAPSSESPVLQPGHGMPQCRTWLDCPMHAWLSNTPASEIFLWGRVGTMIVEETRLGTSAHRNLHLMETIQKTAALEEIQVLHTMQKAPQAQVQAQAQPQAQAQYTVPAAPNNPLANLMHFQEQQPSQQQQGGTSDVPPATQVGLL